MLYYNNTDKYKSFEIKLNVHQLKIAESHELSLAIIHHQAALNNTSLSWTITTKKGGNPSFEFSFMATVFQLDRTVVRRENGQQ